MKHFTKHFFRTLLFSLTMISLLSACTGTPLQSTRLDKAETFMIQAEQALSSNHANKMKIADSNIGTAKAYLLTIKDNMKFLSKNEKKRYKSLLARANAVSSRVVR